MTIGIRSKAPSCNSSFAAKGDMRLLVEARVATLTF